MATPNPNPICLGLDLSKSKPVGVQLTSTRISPHHDNLQSFPRPCVLAQNGNGAMSIFKNSEGMGEEQRNKLKGK